MFTAGNCHFRFRLRLNWLKLAVLRGNSFHQLTQHLQQGGVAICNTAGRGMFSTGGHYVTALGIQGGKVCIADSGLYIGKYSSARRKAAVSVSGDLLFAAPAVLDADCVGRSPRYYLLRQEG